MARTSFDSLSIVCISLLFCSLGPAQTFTGDDRVEIATRVIAKPATELLPAHLRVDTSLVLVPVHVTTRLGVSVTDLNKTNFQIFEDNVEQTITHFAKDDAPLSIGLVVEASACIKNRMRKASEAA